MIKEWINKIGKFHDVYDNTKWMIFGDGMGDFESSIYISAVKRRLKRMLRAPLNIVIVDENVDFFDFVKNYQK